MLVRDKLLVSHTLRPGQHTKGPFRAERWHVSGWWSEVRRIVAGLQQGLCRKPGSFVLILVESRWWVQRLRQFLVGVIIRPQCSRSVTRNKIRPELVAARPAPWQQPVVHQQNMSIRVRIVRIPH